MKVVNKNLFLASVISLLLGLTALCLVLTFQKPADAYTFRVGVVTFDDISPMTTVGDTIYGGAAGTGTRLAAGAQGTLFMGNGAGAPSWLAAGAANSVLLGAGAADPTWSAEAAFKAGLNLEADVDFNAYDPDLTTYAGIPPSADVQAVLAAANEAAIRAFLDLEPATDFYSIAASDAAKFTGGVTVQSFGVDNATPDVSNAALGTNNVYQTANANPTTVTDFDDGDGAAHSEFADGDWFILRVDDANTTIDFSANANIEGNAAVDFTGSATQIMYLLFIYEDARWNCVNLIQGMSDPTTLAISSIRAAMGGATYAGAHTVTAAEMNGIIVMTGAGDVDIPADFCDSATFNWITIKSTAAHLNSVDALDAVDDFVLSDGTNVDGAANEIDLAGAAGSQCTLVCIQTNKWWVTGEIGTCVDGGADN